MENTLENKTKFFAQYWGQNVMMEQGKRLNRYTVGGLDEGFPDHWLELKNIDYITDEEADMLGFDDVNHFFISGSADSMKDELRLLGFAVEWAGWSVEELISFGWIKLKENN